MRALAVPPGKFDVKLAMVIVVPPALLVNLTDSGKDSEYSVPTEPLTLTIAGAPLLELTSFTPPVEDLVNVPVLETMTVPASVGPATKFPKLKGLVFKIVKGCTTLAVAVKEPLVD